MSYDRGALRAARALLTIVIVAHAVPARADVTDTCIRASDLGQVLRDQGQLIAAQDQFRACAAEACPAVVRQACVGWATELRGRIPTVVPVARDEQGHDLVDVRVSLDGRPWRSELDGRALAVDPGPHSLRFEHADWPPVELSVVAREGEHNRLLEVTLAKPPVAVGESPSRPVPWLAIGLGGVAVAAAGGFVVLGLSAKDDVERMRDTCAPWCDASEVTSAKRKQLAANLLLGAALAAASGATYVWLTRAPARRPEIAVSPVADGAGVAVWLQGGW